MIDSVNTPLTRRDLRDLLNRPNFTGDGRPGRLKWKALSGQKLEAYFEDLADAIRYVPVLKDKDATCIQIRVEEDHPWVSFPEKRPDIRTRKQRAERVAEREGR